MIRRAHDARRAVVRRCSGGFTIMAELSHNPASHDIADAAGVPRSLWHNRDFMLLWSGQVVSTLGSQISLLAFPVIFLALTRSPAQTGLLTALRLLPYLLFGLPAGALIDRWDRKRVMLVCDTLRALAMGSIPLALAFGWLTSVQLYLVTFIEGMLSLFFSLAETACLPRVVPRQQLHDATARQTIADSAASVVGPSIFGVLYGVGGAAFPFLIDAITYAASVISLVFVQAPLQAERTAPPRRLWGEMREGWGWLWNHSLIRFLALLVSGLNLSSFGYTLIVLVLAERLGASEIAIGLLFAAGGVGALVGALLVGPLQRRVRFGPLLIGATWLWTITWLPFLFAPNILVLGIAMVISFVAVPIFLTVQYSYRLSQIPDELQGRVNSVFRLVLVASQALSLVLTGALLQAFGPFTAVLLLFVPQVALAILTTMNRQLR
jgi:MFS family permease